MKPACRLTDAEWKVMSVLWKDPPLAATDVVEALAEETEWTLATVRTLLRRLVNKGALKQALDGKRYLYTPRVSLEECARTASESFLDRVLGRAPSAMLLHLVRKAKLTRTDIEELRRILREKEE